MHESAVVFLITFAQFEASDCQESGLRPEWYLPVVGGFYK
jgi:hypothetical protein